MSVPEFPDEVVTKALVRYVDLPLANGKSAGTAALITLDNGHDHTKPSTFGPGGLRSLDAALDEVAQRSDLAAICLTGKPFIFVVGADLNVVKAGGSRNEALELGRLGHRVFRRLKDSAVPTFAFVNGAAMGGGLELALHCHYRTLSGGAAALALPEVSLGLIPGWGGTQLLPALVGADNAVTMIIENPLNQNRMLKPKQALGMGMADVLLDTADFLEESLRWAARVVTGETAVSRPEVDRRAQAWDAAVARGRGIADLKTGAAAPAPYKALDLIAQARTASFEEGTAAEDEALADLAFSEELRAGLYAFDLVQKRAKRPAGAPDKSLARPVGKVGIVGAGLMASQLALLFVQRLEVPVVLTDIDQGRVDKGVGYVHAEIDKMVSKGRVNADAANRLKALVTGSLSKDVFRDADFVIEAVFERMDVKQQVFAEVEAIVKPDCVLATNTSSLSITTMASTLENPARVVGFHFFNPVAVMPLIEIVRGQQTDDPTLATAFAVARTLKKTAILVQDSPSFIVNRILGRFLGEVTRLVDEGTPIEVADRAFAGIAPMPPFMLLGLVGPAIALHNSETLHEAFPDRFYVSENLRRIVSAGKSAVYLWENGVPRVDPEVEALMERPEAPVSLSDAEVRDRTLSVLAQEIRTMLDDGVVAEPQDVDLAMITGAGFAFWNGGITPLLDRTGISERATGRRFLPKGAATLP